jgi:small redox-active disulfide protein 2
MGPLMAQISTDGDEWDFLLHLRLADFCKNNYMIVKVLGTGCPNCKTLEKNTRQAVSEEGLDVTVLKEEDMMKILEYKVMRMPALVIDEQVAMFGRVPSVAEIREIIRQHVS